MRVRRGGLVLGMLALLAGALPAVAQGGRAQTRQGFWFGLGLGYGSLCGEDCDDRAGAVSGYFKLGGTLSQKVLLGFESNAWIKSEDDVTVSQVNGSGVVYFYPSATGGFHLKAGLGFVRATVAVNVSGVTVSSSETGVGGLLGLGYDVRVGRNASLVPFFNVLGGKYNDGSTNFFQIGLGVTVH
jgi:hypothetical protein